MLSLHIDGRPCRFCQQCGRFHSLQEFDGNKRSCRRSLMARFFKRRNLPMPPVALPRHATRDVDQGAGAEAAAAAAAAAPAPAPEPTTPRRGRKRSLGPADVAPGRTASQTTKQAANQPGQTRPRRKRGRPRTVIGDVLDPGEPAATPSPRYEPRLDPRVAPAAAEQHQLGERSDGGSGASAGGRGRSGGGTSSPSGPSNTQSHTRSSGSDGSQGAPMPYKRVPSWAGALRAQQADAAGVGASGAPGSGAAARSRDPSPAVLQPATRAPGLLPPASPRDQRPTPAPPSVHAAAALHFDRPRHLNNGPQLGPPQEARHGAVPWPWPSDAGRGAPAALRAGSGGWAGGWGLEPGPGPSPPRPAPGAGVSAPAPGACPLQRLGPVALTPEDLWQEQLQEQLQELQQQQQRQQQQPHDPSACHGAFGAPQRHPPHPHQQQRQQQWQQQQLQQQWQQQQLQQWGPGGPEAGGVAASAAGGLRAGGAWALAAASHDMAADEEWTQARAGQGGGRTSAPAHSVYASGGGAGGGGPEVHHSASGMAVEWRGGAVMPGLERAAGAQHGGHRAGEWRGGGAMPEGGDGAGARRVALGWGHGPDLADPLDVELHSIASEGLVQDGPGAAAPCLGLSARHGTALPARQTRGSMPSTGTWGGKGRSPDAVWPHHPAKPTAPRIGSAGSLQLGPSPAMGVHAHAHTHVPACTGSAPRLLQGAYVRRQHQVYDDDPGSAMGWREGGLGPGLLPGGARPHVQQGLGLGAEPRYNLPYAGLVPGRQAWWDADGGVGPPADPAPARVAWAQGAGQGAPPQPPPQPGLDMHLDMGGGGGGYVSVEPHMHDAAQRLLAKGGGRMPYTPPPAAGMLERLAVKIHGCTPDQLPPRLAVELAQWLEGTDARVLQGFIRPGCTQLVLELLYGDRDRLLEGLAVGGARADPRVAGGELARRVLGVQGLGPGVNVQMQIGDVLLRVENGVAHLRRRVPLPVGAEGWRLHGPQLGADPWVREPTWAAPELLAVAPLAEVARRPFMLELVGRGLRAGGGRGAPGPLFHVRSRGGHLDVMPETHRGTSEARRGTDTTTGRTAAEAGALPTPAAAQGTDHSAGWKVPAAGVGTGQEGGAGAEESSRAGSSGSTEHELDTGFEWGSNEPERAVGRALELAVAMVPQLRAMPQAGLTDPGVTAPEECVMPAEPEAWVSGDCAAEPDDLPDAEVWESQRFESVPPPANAAWWRGTQPAPSPAPVPSPGPHLAPPVVPGPVHPNWLADAAAADASGSTPSGATTAASRLPVDVVHKVAAQSGLFTAVHPGGWDSSGEDDGGNDTSADNNTSASDVSAPEGEVVVLFVEPAQRCGLAVVEVEWRHSGGSPLAARSSGSAAAGTAVAPNRRLLDSSGGGGGVPSVLSYWQPFVVLPAWAAAAADEVNTLQEEWDGEWLTPLLVDFGLVLEALDPDPNAPADRAPAAEGVDPWVSVHKETPPPAAARKQGRPVSCSACTYGTTAAAWVPRSVVAVEKEMGSCALSPPQGQLGPAVTPLTAAPAAGKPAKDVRVLASLTGLSTAAPSVMAGGADCLPLSMRHHAAADHYSAELALPESESYEAAAAVVAADSAAEALRLDAKSVAAAASFTALFREAACNRAPQPPPAHRHQPPQPPQPLPHALGNARHSFNSLADASPSGPSHASSSSATLGGGGRGGAAWAEVGEVDCVMPLSDPGLCPRRLLAGRGPEHAAMAYVALCEAMESTQSEMAAVSEVAVGVGGAGGAREGGAVAAVAQRGYSTGSETQDERCRAGRRCSGEGLHPAACGGLPELGAAGSDACGGGALREVEAAAERAGGDGLGGRAGNGTADRARSLLVFFCNRGFPHCARLVLEHLLGPAAAGAAPAAPLFPAPASSPSRARSATAPPPAPAPAATAAQPTVLHHTAGGGSRLPESGECGLEQCQPPWPSAWPWAVGPGAGPALGRLLERVRADTGLPLLHHGVRSGCCRTVGLLLAAGVAAGRPLDVREPGPEGVTPLRLAALLLVGAEAMVQLLLHHRRSTPVAATAAGAAAAGDAGSEAAAGQAAAGQARVRAVAAGQAAAVAAAAQADVAAAARGLRLLHLGAPADTAGGGDA